MGRSLNDPESSETVLIVIDNGTARQDHWTGLDPNVIGTYGIYSLWRLSRSKLEQRADALMAEGVDPDWRQPRPERF